jgi:hypothetical protein
MQRAVLQNNAFLIIAFGLLWFLPSFIFWHLHLVKDVLLPKIPEMVWSLPGKSWELSPLLGFGLILAFIVIVLFFREAAVLKWKWVRGSFLVLILLISAVHALWGIALL